MYYVLDKIVVRDKTYDKFIDWLRQNNFPKSKMVLAEFPGIKQENKIGYNDSHYLLTNILLLLLL